MGTISRHDWNGRCTKRHGRIHPRKKATPGDSNPAKRFPLGKPAEEGESYDERCNRQWYKTMEIRERNAA